MRLDLSKLKFQPEWSFEGNQQGVNTSARAPDVQYNGGELEDLTLALRSVACSGWSAAPVQ